MRSWDEEIAEVFSSAVRGGCVAVRAVAAMGNSVLGVGDFVGRNFCVGR